jgi:integrase/recombinase XerC
MSAASPLAPAPVGQADVDAARLLLARLGLSPADLLAEPRSRPTAPTFRRVRPGGGRRGE